MLKSLFAIAFAAFMVASPAMAQVVHHHHHHHHHHYYHHHHHHVHP